MQRSEYASLVGICSRRSREQIIAYPDTNTAVHVEVSQTGSVKLVPHLVVHSIGRGLPAFPAGNLRRHVPTLWVRPLNDVLDLMENLAQAWQGIDRIRTLPSISEHILWLNSSHMSRNSIYPRGIHIVSDNLD